MKVVLFYPRGDDFVAGKPPVSTLAANLPPIGIASIASVLRDAGHTVILFNAALHYRVDDDEWVRRICECDPDFVGFSTLTVNFHGAYRICCGVKETRDTIQTVFGGVHVSWGKNTLFSRFPAIDFVVAGEGEYSFRDLVNGTDPAAIAGLYFRDGSEIGHGPVQDKNSLCSMDELPFPAYDLLDGFPKQYNMPLFSY
ncbi:MAG: B12-binding domain-containing radical SAM protein, partial [Deltaproteobacteria bacterium]|nr:B12-binding domain-containing radical SAM protein [Deltaproteobacteria bacterium]